MRERVIDQLPPAHPPLGICAHPRFMPLARIEPRTFQSPSQRSIHWAKPVSASCHFLKRDSQHMVLFQITHHEESVLILSLQVSFKSPNQVYRDLSLLSIPAVFLACATSVFGNTFKYIHIYMCVCVCVCVYFLNYRKAPYKWEHWVSNIIVCT